MTFSPWGLWRVDPESAEPSYQGGCISISPDGIETWGFEAVVAERRYAWEVTLHDDGEAVSAVDAWGEEITLRFLPQDDGSMRLHLSGIDVFPWELEVTVVRTEG